MATRGSNPVWLLDDLTGNLMDDTYYLWVLENDIPYQPATVWHDASATNEWTNPIQVLANGTLPIDIFFTAETLYRLEFRKNDGTSAPSQSDALIYLITDYLPGSSGGNVITSVSLNTDNQITNAQFSLINFTSPLSLTTVTNQTINVAPGWDLVLPGTGNVELTQVALNSATTIPTNAPYALQINISNWNEGEVYLRQRFDQSGMLWANKYVSASVTAKWASGTSRSLVGKMYSNTPTELVTVLSGDASTNFIELSGNGLMPASTNTTFPPAAYVEFRLYLPSTVNIQLTSFQLIVSAQALTFSYEQDTIQRQIDHTFHVYRDSLLAQPKNSVLTGWDFALNPWQFTTTTSTNVATFGYTADQTIIVQQAYVASASGNNIAVGRGTAAQNYAFEVKSVTATNQFAMIQYIDPMTIRPYWGDVMSSLVKLVAQKQGSSNLRVKMRLIYRSSVPPTLAQAEPILSWTAGSEPVFSTGWTAITPTNDPAYNISNGANTLKFEGMALPESDNASMTLGIVIYTLDSMVQTGTADLIHLNSVSLVPNEFAIESNALTFDETLKRCEYYWQKSFLPGTLPVDNAALASGPTYFVQSINQPNINRIPVRFPISMRTTPVSPPSLYNPTSGSAGQILNVSTGASYSSTQLATSTLSANGFVVQGVPDGMATAGNLLAINWAVDARLGIAP